MPLLNEVVNMIKQLLVYLFSMSLMAAIGQNEEIDPYATAMMIHKLSLVVDTHVDTPLDLMDEGYSMGDNHDSVNNWSKVDIPRMEEGGLDAVFFAAFIGQGPRDKDSHQKSKDYVLEIFDSIYTEVSRYPEELAVATSPRQAYELEEEGKVAIFIGMENGYPIGLDINLVETYYDLGARYITLCHSSNNDLCDSSTDPDGPEHDGLSEFGEKVVLEMNRLGMMIDISHASDSTFYDVLRLSKAPVIASHSCARGVHENPRNLDDEMIRALADKGGVVQVCLVSSYLADLEPSYERDSALQVLQAKYKDYGSLSPEQKKLAHEDWRFINANYPRPLASVPDIADHIDHIVEVAGIDYVGIGSDFDGGGEVDGCYDVSELPNITEELYSRGYSAEEIVKIWGGNIMRVMEEVDSLKSRPASN